MTTLPTLLLKADLSFHPAGTPATNNIMATALKCSVDEELWLVPYTATQRPSGRKDCRVGSVLSTSSRILSPQCTLSINLQKLVF